MELDECFDIEGVEITCPFFFFFFFLVVSGRHKLL